MATSSKLATIRELEINLTAAKNSSVAGTKRADTIIKLEEKLAQLKAEVEKETVPFGAPAAPIAVFPKELVTVDTKIDQKIKELEAQRDSLRKEREATTKRTATSDSLRALEKKLADLDVPHEAKTSTSILKLREEKKKLENSLPKGSDAAVLSAELTELKKKLYGIDICFLVDCTGSMNPWIREVQQKIMAVVEQSGQFAAVPNATVRVGFVGYRDHGDQERFILHDFVERQDLANLIATIHNIKATGGGDGPEDVVGGLQKVLSLSWKSSTRVIIHAADAPCHGREYHNLRDSLPEGDPSGTKPEALLSNIARKRIHYHFLEIDSCTGLMTSRFADAYRSSNYAFAVHPLAETSSLLPRVLESIKSSVKATTAIQSETNNSVMDSIARLESKLARLEGTQ